MTKCIGFGGTTYASEEGETVLDCLSRHGVNVPHSCKSGVCQSCLMQMTDGAVPEAAQKGLKPTFKKQNLFLACQCRPDQDVKVALPDGAAVDTRVTVVGTAMLNHNVLRLDLQPETAFPCEPGQYITLINPAGTARSYSIANDPAREGYIELHIRLIEGGVMSTFLRDHVRAGDALTIRGPAGNCFYVPEDNAANDYPLVLAGTGTGLAPLYGIARQALTQGHAGEVQLFHGALRETDLYLVAELQDLAQRHANFTYAPCVLNGDSGRFYASGNIQDFVMSAVTRTPADKPRTRLFLCGAPEMVGALKKAAFLSGLASRHIFADAFLPSKPAVAA